MRKIIVANVKMNGNATELNELLKYYSNNINNNNAEVVVCLPFPYLYLFKDNFSNLKLGAQNVNNHNTGAYTGEISVDMLSDFNVSYCIVGHSERRMYNAENTMQCYEKIKLLIKNNITPILCVGENLKQKEEGLSVKVIKKQVNGALKRLEPHEIEKVIISYEPVWAINKQVEVNAEDVNNILYEITKVCSKLTKQEFSKVKNKLLYGGSVNKINANKLLQKEYVNGLMIGKQCLNISNFIELCNNV